MNIIDRNYTATETVSAVNSFNDWDPLEEVIVGSIEGGYIPELEESFYLFRWPVKKSEHRVGPVPQKIIEETEEDIANFVDLLESFNVTVRRPAEIDYSKRIATPYWSTESVNALMPRDSMIVVGDKLIETPMVCRSRQCETLAYKDLLLEYFRSGCNWISAPKPRLLNDAYLIPSTDTQPSITEVEPIFDAANILRIGEDLFYNTNISGNLAGMDWMQRLLGDTFRLHSISVSPDHIDTTMIPIGPGRILVNPHLVNEDNIPEQFKSWEMIKAPSTPPEQIYGLEYPWCSDWIGLNLFSIDPHNVVVEAGQTELIKILEKQKNLNVIPLRYRHGKTFGGGWHCITLDVRRRGTLQNYF
ncbi:hypothetical protein [Pseudovibrio sp. WM33]|uniref:hypothetical protein n=1 Tax=Pseudovibrio sp. WM33 TaxID=1735585 RepID=UPI0007AEC384|nr:hypothetical protein [Pseudovibrio sp. WM33]KZL24674.1 Inosamine-phosphate amidinotransferase 1 [Pseudovibrio sp. WM33]